MEGNTKKTTPSQARQQDIGTSRTSTQSKRTTRRSSVGEDQDSVGQSPALTAKRKRTVAESGADDQGIKMKKGENGAPEPTNAEIMRGIHAISAKFDTLATRADLANVEKDLRNQITESSRGLQRKIQDNTRNITQIQKDITEHKETLQQLQQEVDRNKNLQPQTGPKVRADQRKAKYLRARRSIRIWPIETEETATDEDVRDFFHHKMRVPASLANEVTLDVVRPAPRGHPRSKVHNEYVVAFGDQEGRDAIKAYANKLAEWNGQAGLRLEVPDHLKGSYKILEQHANTLRNLYGTGVKRNIKFDDRNDNLMLDVKLPTGPKWHNITIKQATEASQMREELDLQTLRYGITSSSTDEQKERARAMLMHNSPGKNPQSSGNPLQLKRVATLDAIEAEDDDANDTEDSITEIIKTSSRR